MGRRGQEAAAAGCEEDPAEDEPADPSEDEAGLPAPSEEEPPPTVEAPEVAESVE